MSNPFVVGATSVTTPFSGAGLLEDGASLKAAIDGGDWLSGGLSAVSAVADTASAVMNPIAALVSWGVGWLLDHLEMCIRDRCRARCSASRPGSPSC